MVWTVADSSGATANPHSDLIFRATDAKTCMDCHRVGKDGLMLAQVEDNRLVQELKAKAKLVRLAFRRLFALSRRRQQG
ncbi:MAG: hypothetical protein MRJ92_01495 [Nitrospira sp.]|nr:hypothetical protein [Nitrospira sp.]